jgi:hypothetical protein
LVWCPWNSDEIKRHPEVEVLLVARDNRTEVMKKVSNWLMERVKRKPLSEDSLDGHGLG